MHSSIRISVKASTEARFISGHARRREALDRQKRERQSLTAAHRQALIEAVVTAPSAEIEQKPSAEVKHEIICEIPEWMVDVPDDLFEKWSVATRPEGQRCIVLCQYGRTSLRSVENRFIRACNTPLPNGSPNSGASAQATLLECILQDRYLFVMDVLSWKGYHLINSSREFRQYWLQTKIVEDDACRVSNEFDLVVVPLFSQICSPETISAAHRGFEASSSAHSDGMVFYHNDSLYTSGCTPLTLLWKDAKCSRYYIEGNPQEKQQICLHCDSTTGSLSTEDGVVIGRIEPSTLGANAKRLQKFTIDEIDLNANSPNVIGIQHIGFFAATKLLAHTWSKILFQYGARQNRNLVSIGDLLGRMS